jgi:hypothetical protein
MFGSLQDWISNIGIAAGVYVVALSVLRRSFLKYFPLNFYVLAVAGMGVTRRLVLQNFGWESLEYRYVYYYSDVLLTVFLYLAILSLYQQVFAEMHVSKYIRGGGTMLLLLTAGISYMMVQQNTQNLTGRFVVGLSQNLYFVGVVLTYVLWGAVMQLRETRTRIVQLVLALGVFFSAHAVFYAARHLFPSTVMQVPWVASLLGISLPLAWAYTFTMVPEEARLETARVAARAAAHR